MGASGAAEPSARLDMYWCDAAMVFPSWQRVSTARRQPRIVEVRMRLGIPKSVRNRRIHPTSRSGTGQCAEVSQTNMRK
jgi:hypothetical protein